MKIPFTGLLTACLIHICSIQAQETQATLTLEDCIEIALDQNFSVQRAELNAQGENIQYKQSRNALLPRVNADYNYGVSNGRSIDPFTNAYVTEQLNFSNAGLSLSATVFNGFRLLNSLKQSSLNKAAAEMDLQESRQNRMLDVTLSFLQVLNARELVKLAETRLLTTQEQLKRLAKLNEEETGNPSDFYDLQGQLTTDQNAITDATNSLKNALEDLKFLLNTDAEIEAENLVLVTDFKNQELSADGIYERALQSLAAIKARELRLEATAKGVAVARSQYIPEISLFANLNTNYSSAARLFEETGNQLIETADFVNISGTDYSVFTEETQFESRGISYKDQLNNNLNSTVGVAVSIPLFNGFRAKNNVQLQKIEQSRAEVDLAETKRALKQNIAQAYNDWDAAESNYELLQEQVAAYEKSFAINEARFNLGVATSVEYITSKNRLDNARINLTNTRYTYLLRDKVLEFYQGNAIR
ncbi:MULTISPECIES: TolC family protein [unclassified Leeuwenhoekiella]|uniref:TolC family protein n=1 Tax=unclassified Leeuwenhoekiella TaxID=2615029 RepID=UPI000C686754|nr:MULTISPECIES: TolC family protein [unclassified Leeuwenhoekiella]MAW96925.1 transporter [Leeuwenhoekiella sp.]MBA80629.1 transporter [Leeuwenhoekiella sp.]|tara:strand:+ start:1097 stop:2521 length:1425 start_codon:yes stop_codon:yes gene_type:complete